MKNSAITFIRISILAVLIFSYENTLAQISHWENVEKVFGKKGSVKDDIFKITFPRSDLKVKVGEVSVESSLALTSWIAFEKMGDQTMIMGDLVLLDAEVYPVMSKLIASGVQVTALHNHILNETPAVKYMHFSGTGETGKLAEIMKSALSATGTPMGASQTTQISSAVDWTKIESAMGSKGQPKGDVLQFGIPRMESVRENGMAVPPFMGTATAVNFQMAGDKAAATGDFVLIAEEVNGVVKTLVDNGIAVTAIHNHMLFENPRMFMVHFWGYDEPGKLAKGIKAALDKTNSKK